MKKTQLQPIESPTLQEDIREGYYMNLMQIRANLIDANVQIMEVARAGGKTEGVFGPRIVKVANSMPGELGFLVHKTYAALLTNIWPNIQAWFARPIHDGRRSMLEYGVDYIVGEGKIPGHFRRPRYPIVYPKHSILFRNGFHLQLVSSDQPESVAGRSGVHAFIEEMKHQKGEKLKTRLFPSLRGSDMRARQSPYYQGITGVSDTARVDLGEDNWFEEYERNMSRELIDEIATVSYHVNKLLFRQSDIESKNKSEKNPVVQEAVRLELEKIQRALAIWTPRLSEMRRNATYYARASSFVNKDILGPKFFRTQRESLDIDEFLTAICAIRRRAVVDRFFAAYEPSKHQFSDSIKYNEILKVDLKDHFELNASHLKYYDPDRELLLGYDPGAFASLVVGQENENVDTMRLLKEFFTIAPKGQAEMAAEFNRFFGSYAKSKRLLLYFDRAANKRREDAEQITTDAKLLQRELESYGFDVELMDEGRATIYHWQQYKLLLYIFSRNNSMPRVLIDDVMCPNLCSAIMLSPKKTTDGRIELDKSSERKVQLRHQAGLTTQLPSALIYLLFGRYSGLMPSEYSQLPPDLPSNSIA